MLELQAFSLAGEPGTSAMLIAPFAAYAALAAQWRRLCVDVDANAFWACATAIAVLWHLSIAPLPDGPSLHALGAAVACALFGWRHAIVAMMVGIALQRLAAGAGWDDYLATVLLGAVLPVAVSHVVIGLARLVPVGVRPAVLVAAGYVAGAASALALAGALWLFDALPGTRGSIEFAALGLHLAFVEANLSAFVLTLVVVSRPDWLRRYVDPR